MRYALVALLLLLAGPSSAANMNVVMVVIDGLRADHLGCYGYKRPTSPNIDALAADSVLFERAGAQSSWTLPSFASFLSSQYVERAGVTHQQQRLKEGTATLASALAARGYKTAAFGAGPYVHALYGVDQGFQTFRSTKNNSFKEFSSVVAMARDYVELHKKDRFFLLLHDNDLHPPFDIPDRLPEQIDHPFLDGPYTGPMDGPVPDYAMFVKAYNSLVLKDRGAAPRSLNISPTAPQTYFDFVDKLRKDPNEVKHLVAHYDERIAHSDRLIKEFWDFLKAKGLERNTVLVIFSDHGLEWGERGLIGTGFHTPAWESILHVPLIIKHPSLPPARVPDLVQLVDVAPTVLDLLGTARPRQFQGRSLVPLLRGSKAGLPARPAFADVTSVNAGAQEFVRVVRDGNWKLINSERRQTSLLFDLEKDPDELDDASPREAEVFARLSRLLAEQEKLNKTVP